MTAPSSPWAAAQRLFAALERRFVPDAKGVDFSQVLAARWAPGPLGGRLVAGGAVDSVGLEDLVGLEAQRARVVANVAQFVAGLPANNMLLWGARGTGKSSLVHGVLNHFAGEGLRLLEVERDALGDLPEISERLGALPYRFLLFCDDLSFEGGELGYKALKSALEGTVFAAAGNVMLVATSNRRHLLPERAAENQQFTHTDTGEVHPGETTEEKLSLADRFGLWVSFHPMAQPAYLEAAARWVAHYGAPHGVSFDDAARAAALTWALTRGARSGRVAHHFARHWVGQVALAARQSRG
jgi:predicted AAA+ superfamily ATPase